MMKKTKKALRVVCLPFFIFLIACAYGTTKVSNDTIAQSETLLVSPLLDSILQTDTLLLHYSTSSYEIEELSAPDKLLESVSPTHVFVGLKADKIEQISQLPDQLVYFGNHPFLLGMLKAYQEHRPFVISPDMIWLLIEQGFARHIAVHAEKFRNKLVGFQGKRELTVVVDSTQIKIGHSDSQWDLVFPQFVDQIERYTGTDYVKNLRSDFSTTDADSKIASEIVLMESVKVFFDYRVMMIGCGISSVTIEGTVADWEKILKKIEYIDTYDLAWWTTELKPIIQEIIHTKKGQVNKEFWRNMVQLRDKAIYVPHETIDGWITKFYPFNDKGEQRELLPIVNVKGIAAEYVKVPFILEDRTTQKEYAMEFWAGMFGMEQDKRNYRLKPAIGWAIVHSSRSLDVHTPPDNSYDDVSLKNIKQIPDAFFALRQIGHLTLGFLGKVNIPNRIKGIKIRHLEVTGEISQKDIARLKELLPNTHITINQRSVQVVRNWSNPPWLSKKDGSVDRVWK